MIKDISSKIYFVGIGGIGMSAAASLATLAGFTVNGSDSEEVYSPAKDVLEKEGIEFFVGYDESHIQQKEDWLFVISSGESLSNPEVKYIYEKNLKHIGLAEFLFLLSSDKIRAVVTGTNGKSTTTAMLGSVLHSLDGSSFFAGAVLQNTGENFASGNGHYFVFEGDEYKEEFDNPTPKFHFYKPDILVLTNLEYDHPDLFENFEDLKQEFELLVSSLPPDGLLVYNADNIHLSKLAHMAPCSTVSFGIHAETDFKVENIQYGQYTTLEVINKHTRDTTAKILGLTETYKTQLPGELNVYNTLAVVATLRALGFSQEQIMLEVLSFRGVKRRFEVVSEKNNISVIDDYAHHPTAVRETLKAARLKYFSSQTPGRLWAVFEPHTFSRTQATLQELAGAFEEADEVMISEIYPAREKISKSSITSDVVLDAIKVHNTKFNVQNSVRKVASKEEALNILKKELKPGDVVVVMAVGSFNRLAYELKEIL